MHVSQFEIRSFRNVRPATLSFRRGLNVVLGKNAAGKTTLLNLLSDSIGAWPELSDDRAIEYTVVASDGRLKRTLERTTDASQTPTSLAPTQRTRDVFELSQGTTQLTASVANGRVEISGQPATNATGPLAFNAVIERLAQIDRTLAKFLLTTSWIRALRMDESLEYFNLLMAFAVTRTNGSSTGNMGEGEPLSFSNFLAKPIQLDGDGPSFEPEFLKRAVKVMGYESAEAVFDLESKSNGGLSETTLRNLRFRFRSRGDRFLHSSLSYGERRLLGFFALSDACPEIMVIDELVNGLHHDWIKACLDEIGGRQAFLTSQNPLLLDYLDFESAEDVQSGFVLCERLPGKQGSELVWRNPTAEEAGDFFSAYETGIQRVSDILINKGFW